jgi:hypothetical protein
MLFILRAIRSTQIHSVGRMQAYSMLKQVVHIITTELWRIKYIGYTRDYCVFGPCLSSDILKDTAFRKLDLFPSSYEGMGDTYSSGSIGGR